MQSDFIEFDQDFDGINARGKLQKKFLFGANSLNVNLASVLSSLNFPSLTTTVLKTVSSTATIACKKIALVLIFISVHILINCVTYY